MDKSLTTTEDLLNIADRLKIKIKNIIYKDQLKNLKPEPGAYIINMANSDDGTYGTHWTGLWLDKKNKESFYFDSIGFPPPTEVLNFMKRFNNKSYIYNSLEYQNFNYGHCGQYVMLFLAAMFLGKEKDLEKRLINYFTKYNVDPRTNN